MDAGIHGRNECQMVFPIRGMGGMEAEWMSSAMSG